MEWGGPLNVIFSLRTLGEHGQMPSEGGAADDTKMLMRAKEASHREVGFDRSERSRHAAAAPLLGVR